ncbi:hypothetical protein Rhe02_32630 [Rhizocola hellebori]|uniref:Uncharacterized protein n=1 Tax=Rhizocola hellebori TaxID=1392758 RepID=A0A8J3Q8L4_9ACTN|nr:hypothetical protein Rhe02_32630 [Rhizocola hellebori]
MGCGKFMKVASTSKWAPTERHPEGELHEDLGFFSWDKTRKLFVLRQFHVEGFVNQYIAEVVADAKIVFVTEAIENIPDGWRARETYTFLGPEEFIEQFELAAPGKDFEPYTENRLHRVAPE